MRSARCSLSRLWLIAGAVDGGTGPQIGEMLRAVIAFAAGLGVVIVAGKDVSG